MSDTETRVKRAVRVRDLPRELTISLDAGPDTEVMVTVEVAEVDQLSRLKAAFARVGAQAEANGLTQEILDEIVDEK